jgi:hypothetical protein
LKKGVPDLEDEGLLESSVVSGRTFDLESLFGHVSDGTISHGVRSSRRDDGEDTRFTLSTHTVPAPTEKSPVVQFRSRNIGCYRGKGRLGRVIFHHNIFRSIIESPPVIELKRKRRKTVRNDRND